LNPGLGQYISGAIMFDETLFQKAKDGTPFVDILKKQGILPGIKVGAASQCFGWSGSGVFGGWRAKCSDPNL
jgi:fructose-bisphosphate aldolase class I